MAESLRQVRWPTALDLGVTEFVEYHARAAATGAIPLNAVVNDAPAA